MRVILHEFTTRHQPHSQDTSQEHTLSHALNYFSPLPPPPPVAIAALTYSASFPYGSHTFAYLSRNSFVTPLCLEFEGEALVFRTHPPNSSTVNPPRSSMQFYGKRLSFKSLRYTLENIRASQRGSGGDKTHWWEWWGDGGEGVEEEREEEEAAGVSVRDSPNRPLPPPPFLSSNTGTRSIPPPTLWTHTSNTTLANSFAKISPTPHAHATNSHSSDPGLSALGVQPFIHLSPYILMAGQQSYLSTTTAIMTSCPNGSQQDAECHGVVMVELWQKWLGRGVGVGRDVEALGFGEW
ncbi:unnamed protein product [Tuber aestivum]|uniref:Uncharacterized protein n=1 Tax=Tuber aestivum TaxID=59557 RepID=A0A292Q0Q0_9PEZI|nr:unnamed protein product [Tuber aestivum]